MIDSADVNTFDESGRRVSTGGEQHTGQARIAHRLAGAYRDRLLFVHGIGWHRWDGTRWAVDLDETHAYRAVLDVVRSALAESVGDKQLRADATRCESDAGVSGVLAIARRLVEFAATVDDVDADPALLNTATGTLDLRTMTLREHDPADRLTKVTAAGYRRHADPQEWAGFLERVLPDPDERAYLQRVVGQALYGRVGAQLFPVLTGTGANGKSTATGALTATLGDYAAVIDPALLVNDRGRPPGPETMQLLGARLVIASETSEGSRLDEATMKRLTGGDPITARHLYREPVTWTPSHQLLYVTNRLPAVKGNDPAVWRRIRVIPFNVVIPASERDPELSERLTLHADAILSWAVAGWQDYRAGGMREPASVLTATEEYQADSVGRIVLLRVPSAQLSSRTIVA